MADQVDWPTLRQASADHQRELRRRIKVGQAIHLVAAAADAKRYAQWIIENADKALERLAMDGIYPDSTPVTERSNPVAGWPELNYPGEKIRLLLTDLDTAHRLTQNHLSDAEQARG